MASLKNSSRSKRKYGDKRQAATASNKANKKARAELHELNKIARTQALVGKEVEIRTRAYGKIVETVQEIVPAPFGSSRTSGQFVKVIHNGEEVIRSRHRVKPV